MRVLSIAFSTSFAIAAALWAFLYLVALLLFVVGAFGLFGAGRDPLAGMFLVPLGLPWIRFVDLFPEPLWPWLAALTPILNIFILYSLHRLIRNR